MAYAYIRDLGMKENSVFINEKSENLSEAYKFKVDLQVQSLLQVPNHFTHLTFLGIIAQNQVYAQVQGTTNHEAC